MRKAPANRFGLGTLAAAGILIGGCACDACRTEPPPVVRMERAHAEADRQLSWLAGRASTLKQLTYRARVDDEAGPEELGSLRRRAGALWFRATTWRDGSSAVFKSEAYMTLPPTHVPDGQPPRTEEVQVVETDPDAFYTALNEAFPELREQCDQFEQDLTNYLARAASDTNKQAARQ